MWKFVGVVLRIVFVSEVGLVVYELHAIDVADAALYPVVDQCYQGLLIRGLLLLELMFLPHISHPCSNRPPSPLIKVGFEFVMELWFYGIKSILN